MSVLEMVAMRQRGVRAGSAPDPGPATVYSVDVSPASATLYTGKTQQMAAVARDTVGDIITGRTVTWTSSNPAVATISAGGLLTLLTTGSTTVTATVDGVSGTSAITVAVEPVTPVVSVWVRVTSPFRLVGVGKTFTAQARPLSGASSSSALVSGKTVVWQSSNPAVALVEETSPNRAAITIVGTGTADITAAVDGVTSASHSYDSRAPETITASFDVASRRGNHDVELHHTSVASHVASGGVFDVVTVDWGDGSPPDALRENLDTPDAVRRTHHSYKASGTYTVTVSVSDSCGATATATAEHAVTLGALDTTVPYGRFFGGRDQFPGVDTRTIYGSQPWEYLDTTPPTEGTDNPSLVKTAATKAEIDLRFAELGVTGGTILYTGAGDIGSWTMPARPFDGLGVAYSTWIWLRSADTVRPVGYPAWGERITPTIGVQVPQFHTTTNGGQAITATALGNYRVRITGFGIRCDYTGIRSGGGLVTLGELTHNIVFEQCYSYFADRDNVLVGCRRDFYINGGWHAIIDGWHWGNRDDSSDSQAVWSNSMTGPLKLVNNFLSGCEPWMTGGAKPISGEDPELPYRNRDMEIRMCHLWRDGSAEGYNVRYYRDGGKVLTAGVGVSSYDTTTRVLTLASAITPPNGSFAWPNPSGRNNYLMYVESGTGAGSTMLVSSFTDSTTLVLAPSNSPAPITTLDATSVVSIRHKVLWWTKNNGEFKDCRRAWVSECVFENGTRGTDSQYFMLLFKTTVNSSTDYYPWTVDVTVRDCMFLNVGPGGIAVARNPSYLTGGFGRRYGTDAVRFDMSNLLLIAGDQQQLAGGSINTNKIAILAADHIRFTAVSALGQFAYGVLMWSDDTRYAHQTIRGVIAPRPNTSPVEAYWWYNASRLDMATSDVANNGIYSATGIGSGAPGGGASWTATVENAADVYMNPDKTDLFGSADFAIKPTATFYSALGADTLDWPRLKARTTGVRADLPYQWDD